MTTWDEFEEGGMIELDENRACEVNRKVTPVFFLIDVSESMTGEKIDTVNRAMKGIMHDLGELYSADYDIRYAVLSFGSDCKWETGENELIMCDGEWADLSTCDGESDFNTACRMLKEKLSVKHNSFFYFANGKTITPPVIILLTDGFVNNDDPDGLKELNTNRYFRGSFKIAIAIGENANLKLCENFTGNKETVWTAYNQNTLEKILKAIATASIYCTGDAPMDDEEDKDSEITESEIQKLKEAIKSEFESDFTDESNESLVDDGIIPINNGETWDSDWDDEIQSEYRIEGKEMQFNETYDVCVCQFGKSTPDEALNAVYKVSVAYQNKLTVKNVSDECREVVVRLKPGEEMEISKPDSVELTYGNQTVSIHTSSWSKPDSTWE